MYGDIFSLVIFELLVLDIIKVLFLLFGYMIENGFLILVFCVCLMILLIDIW